MTTAALIVTPSQTVGPFFWLGAEVLATADLAGSTAKGQAITIEGRVIDGDGRPVIDALVETWQADALGRYAGSDDASTELATAIGFRGFGRVATDAAGRFRLRTVRPGRVAGPDASVQAPHLAVNIFMRGLLKHLVTRVYLADEPSNEGDPILTMVDPSRRRTLIAVLHPGAEGVFIWDIHLQGPEETVFFDI